MGGLFLVTVTRGEESNAIPLPSLLLRALAHSRELHLHLQDLVASQRPLPTPSHWGAGLPHVKRGGVGTKRRPNAMIFQ